MPAALGELYQFIFLLDSPIGAAINTIIVCLFALGLLDALYALGRLVWEGWVIRGARLRLSATSPRATKGAPTSSLGWRFPPAASWAAG